MFFCLWHSHVANVPPMEYTADYTLLHSVPGRGRRISISLNFFFLQLLLLPRTCRGFVVTPFCSLPDFFNSERLMLTNLCEGNYLSLIKKSEYFLPLFPTVSAVGQGYISVAWWESVINWPLEISNLYFLIWHRVENFSFIQNCHNPEN